ncbi:hypothetical protein M8C21_003361, partial [Ambrosia artemisiifolia]
MNMRDGSASSSAYQILGLLPLTAEISTPTKLSSSAKPSPPETLLPNNNCSEEEARRNDFVHKEMIVHLSQNNILESNCGTWNLCEERKGEVVHRCHDVVMNEMQNIIGVTEASFTVPNWKSVQLYKPGMEEVSAWGWPLQTSGKVSTDFGLRSFTVLFG